MIDLTRLNGHRLFVNSDLIKFVEATPDTTLTLLTGERLIVRESCEHVVDAVADWRSGILQRTWPDGLQALTANSSREAIRRFEAGPTKDSAHQE
jgi:flagellar protein FlbD